MVDFTDKYDLEKTDYGTEGWNAILTANMEKLDAGLHTYLEGTLGEALSQYEAGYVGLDGKWYKAQADDLSSMPCLGVAIEAGALDEVIRFQRIGPIENVAWAWEPGKPVFLSRYVAGGLTQVKTVNAQLIGIAISATKVILSIQIPLLEYQTVTTTTTTTTSTTTTT
jgi:hypothetical protein